MRGLDEEKKKKKKKRSAMSCRAKYPDSANWNSATEVNQALTTCKSQTAALEYCLNTNLSYCAVSLYQSRNCSQSQKII